MLRRITFAFILLTFIIGCSEIESPVNVVTEQSSVELLKFPSTKKSSSTASEYIYSREIDGRRGGIIRFQFKMDSGIQVSGKLKIPRDAFDSKEVITIIFDDNFAVADFYPSPYTFDKPLELDLIYKGINLTDVSNEDLEFGYYLDNGSFEYIDFKNKYVSKRQEILAIFKAKLNHFSRAGWRR